MNKTAVLIGLLVMATLVSGCVKETPTPTTTAPPTVAPSEEFPDVEAPLPEEQIEEPEFASDETVDFGSLL